MFNKVLKNFLIFLFICSVNQTLFCQESSTNLPADLTEAIKEGETAKAYDLCGNILFSADAPDAGARAHVIISLLLFLDADPGAASRAKLVGRFFADSEDPEEQNTAAVLSYLAGNSSEEKLSEQMKEKTSDWKATAAVAKYIKNLNDLGIDSVKLNACVTEYMAFSEELPADSWGDVWKTRIIRWHNSLSDTEDTGDGLEKLIFKTKDDILNGPIKKKIIVINNILELLLKNKTDKALQSTKKAIAELGDEKELPENEPYIHLLDYLGGEKRDIKTVYQENRENPEMLLMTSLAAFVKELSEASNGNINKSSLMVHLDNYSDNLQNTKLTLIHEWEPKVNEWKEWCSNDFPLSKNLAPLLESYSKTWIAKNQALIAKNKEKLAMEPLLKLYGKIRSSKSLKRVSINDYKKIRRLVKNRPQPADLSFNSIDPAYINSLPSSIQPGEAMRIRYMKVFKENMIKNLNFSQYSGSIKLQKKTFKGQVVKADKNYIEIATGSSRRIRRSGKKYKWSDLKIEQYLVFADSYIRNNLGGKVKKGNIFSSRDATSKVLCREYRLLAIFCDWYGRYTDAMKYGRKAASFSYDKGATKQLLLQ